MTLTIVFLLIANVFMTLAWYGHLKFFKGEQQSMPKLILLSWGIAFVEYCFQVPANRIGYQYFSATQLKIIQEAITMVVFIAFAVLVLGETLRWNHMVAFALVFAAVYFAVGIK
jgi:uncharacterized protein